MMNLALVGYGKMGKMIESLLDPKEFKLTGTFDVTNPPKTHLSEVTDVAIEFTNPANVIGNIEFLASKGINIVCGTTGWYDKINVVKDIVSKYNTGFVFASNFSVGVNIYFKIIKEASKLFNNFGHYSVSIEETHHTQKLDKPSGTAISIAKYVIESLNRKEKYTNDSSDPSDNELNIVSKRIENIVGNHKLVFESQSDSIIIEHNAKSRRGFAEGALIAAKFINCKKGFFKFEDIFNNLT
ncbi:MAG: 4-hydroxy-tetrahydrodipicolinate reductase [Ignavibacteria bacterium]|nr:4-hydroxy-tetrahydrodipicolinate reductase [Ignavibacteria bacterium]